MKKCLRIMLAGWWVLAGSAVAADYYVAQKDSGANDANPGTIEKPFKTITSGLTHLKPGDTLYVRAGTYRESVAMLREPWDFLDQSYPSMPSGQSDSRRIRVIAYEEEKPLVKGSDVVTGWTKYKEDVYVKDWAVNSQQVFCDGVLLQQIGGEIDPANIQWWRGRKGDSLADLEAGSFFVDVPGKKLYVWLKDGTDPNAHEMEVSVRPFLLWVRLDYVHIRGLSFMHDNMLAKITWPASVLQGAFNIAEDCDFTWCDFSGLSVSGKFNTLIRCKMNHNGNNGFGAGGRGHRFIDCEFSFNNHQRWSASWHAGGMKVNGYDLLFSGCTFEGNIESPGFWNDGECSNLTIENSRAIRNGCGIMIEIGRKVVIRNNIVAENGRGIYISSSSDCDILHNICYRNGGSGIAILGTERMEGWYFDDEKTGFMPARNNVVWGNILVDNCWPEFCIKEPDGRGKSWDTRAELILPNPALSSNGGCVSDYNIYWRSPGRVLPFWYNWHEVEIADLAAWQEQTGHDRHSIIARPLFLDEAQMNFRPAKGSPAISLVKPHMGDNIDYNDTPRSARGYYTAGPFEAPVEFTPPPPPRPATDLSPAPFALPEEKLVELAAEGDLAPLTEALKELEVTQDANGNRVATIKGIPFTIGKAIVMDENNTNVRIPIGKGVLKLHLLVAAIDPPKGPNTNVAYCNVLRQDGVGNWVTWTTDTNIGPSIGAWTPLPPVAQRYGDLTDVGWQSKDGNVRLFITSWENDNYWYPIRLLNCGLCNTGKFIILGVTIQPDK